MKVKEIGSRSLHRKFDINKRSKPVVSDLYPEDFKRYGSPNAVDYFRLLEVDGDHLIIGAA
jgi:hypothetical protein